MTWSPAAPRFGGLAIGAALAAGAAWVVYAMTMARTVGFIDRGELAAVATTLGIAHPTGYPLLTCLGHLASRLAPGAPLLALNLSATVWVAAGVGVLVLVYEHLLARLPSDSASRLPPGVRVVCAAAAALATGFTTTWWQQANGFEAYALHALLLPLVAWTFLRYVETAGEPSASRRWAFGCVTGLSFANHLTTAAVGPAFLMAFLARYRREAGGEALRLVPAFVVGCLPYAYLPLRAAAGPRFSWGDPDTPWRFFVHVTGRQYQDYLFTDFATAGRQFAFMFGRQPWEWVGVGLAFAGIGLWALRRRPAYGLAIAAIAGTAAIWASAYAIRDIEPYGMPIVMSIGACVAAGLAALGTRWGSPAAVGVGGLAVLLALGLHWRSCDERGNTLVADYVRNVLEELPPGAVLASTQWDHLVSPAYYVQTVEHVRADVVIVDPVLMHWSWYVRELNRRAPDLAGSFSNEAARFLAEVDAVERGRAVDRSAAVSAYDTLLAGLYRGARAGGRRVFVTWEVDVPAWRALVRTPRGLTSELGGGPGQVPAPLGRYRFRPWEGRRDHYVATMARNYGEPMAQRAAYEAGLGRADAAREAAAYGASFAPSFGMADLPRLPFDARDLVANSLDLFQRLRIYAAQGTVKPDTTVAKP